MKTKQVWSLGVILAVLLAGVVVRQMQKPAELATEEFTSLDLSFQQDKVQKIDISKPRNASEEQYSSLSKDAEGWKSASMNGARADQGKIEELLKALDGIKGELRGRGKKLFADFGIDDDHAYVIALADAAGKNILKVYIGNKITPQQSIFIRREGSDSVYISDAGLFNQIGINGDPASANLANDFWAATDMVHFESAKINRLEIKRKVNGREVSAASVKKENGVWKFTRAELPFPADETKVKQYLDGIKTWRAQRAVKAEAGKDFGFDKNEWQLTLGVEGGNELTLTAGNAAPEGNGHYFKSSSEPVFFQLGNYYYENLDADDSQFFPDNFLKVDPDKTQKLIIYSQKRSWEFSPADKKWEELTKYLEELKTFRFERILFDDNAAKSVSKPVNWIEIQKTDETVPEVIEAGGAALGGSKEYAVRMKQAPGIVFSISESNFKKLFENLDRLAEPDPLSQKKSS